MEKHLLHLMQLKTAIRMTMYKKFNWKVRHNFWKMFQFCLKLHIYFRTWGHFHQWRQFIFVKLDSSYFVEGLENRVETFYHLCITFRCSNQICIFFFRLLLSKWPKKTWPRVEFTRRWTPFAKCPWPLGRKWPASCSRRTWPLTSLNHQT